VSGVKGRAFDIKPVPNLVCVKWTLQMGEQRLERHFIVVLMFYYACPIHTIEL